MKVSLVASAAVLVAHSALAGGVERSTQSVATIFEPGNYIEFSYTTANPQVSGTQVLVFPPSITGSSSGNMADGYGQVGMSVKFAVTEKLDVALIYDNPFGAGVAYAFPTAYFATGSTAALNTTSFTAVGRYRFGDNFSAIAGIRQQRMNASAIIPFIPGGYMGTASSDSGLGYLVGVAYERPDIALRVALTYNSTITHDMPTVETSALGVNNPSTTSVDTPQSVNLEFQTGIAPKTLLFGSVRWVDWSEFMIAPADYGTIVGGPLVSFADDTITYSLGVGRQLNEHWAAAFSVTHEPATGGLKSNLAPTDGRSAVGVGVTYRQDNMKLQAGVQHIWIGDATTSVFGAPGGAFTGNSALAFGMKVGFSF
ncbi:MAG: outer membrane protein transport protein [Rhodobacter sp.]|nr:outer membrane protein transport protein [Rhodobacter sp.]